MYDLRAFNNKPEFYITIWAIPKNHMLFSLIFMFFESKHNTTSIFFRIFVNSCEIGNFRKFDGAKAILSKF